MITVVHLITGLGSGGAEQMLTRIATHAYGPSAPRQIVISLMDEGMYGASLRAAGVELYCLGMRRGRLSPKAVLRLLRLLHRTRPDLLMTWLYHADLLGILAAPLAGVRRVVWNLRCSEMDFSRYAPTTRWAVLLLARLSTLPWGVATNSQAGRRAHEALGYHPRRWLYLPNGFDLDEWRPDATDRAAVRSDLNIDDTSVAVGMVARVDPQKDHSTFLAAAELVAARNPRTCFVLIGRNTDKLKISPVLSGRLRALGERRDVARLLRGLDIAVLSSYGEGFPNSLGEAMATGLPCVATDVGDAALLVGDQGHVVPVQDPAALASALAELVVAGPEQRARIGAGARERVAAAWSIADSAAAYLNCWQKIGAG